MPNTKWMYNKIEEAESLKMADKLNINLFLVKVLMARGYDNESKISDFLYGWKNSEYDPYLMKDMEKGVETIKSAVLKGEKITVYGDYDCDGITSTAIMVDFLRSLGADTDYYIPDRITEGYGLSIQALDIILKRGAKLIVTVDCGITARTETDYINDNGASIVITDHHQCAGAIPNAKAVINPNRPDCNYPFKMLAGVGVAYKLIQALCKEFNMGDIYYTYVDLVSLGTIADVVSITGENRRIVSMGLKNIIKTNNLGLNALVEISKINKYKIDSKSFAFGLSPRINAAGRMGNAEIALQLILAKQPDLARELAYLLEVSNKQRQITESDNTNTVIGIFQENPGILERQIIIVSSNKLHIGVAGIVAAKITEQYNKPCILLVEEEGKDGKLIAKGSARSVEGINIFELLLKCADILLEYGGHALAAGITIAADKIDLLSERLDKILSEADVKADIFPKTLKADIMLDMNDITVGNINSLEMMEPYGHSNESPVFISEDVVLKNVRALGADGKHLKFAFSKDGTIIEAIAFNMGNRRDGIKLGNKYNIIYNLENNEWQNNITPQIKLIDFTESDTDDVPIEVNCLYG